MYILILFEYPNYNKNSNYNKFYIQLKINRYFIIYNLFFLQILFKIGVYIVLSKLKYIIKIYIKLNLQIIKKKLY